MATTDVDDVNNKHVMGGSYDDPEKDVVSFDYGYITV